MLQNALRSLKLLDLLHVTLKRADRYRAFITYLRVGKLAVLFFFYDGKSMSNVVKEVHVGVAF